MAQRRNSACGSAIFPTLVIFKRSFCNIYEQHVNLIDAFLVTARNFSSPHSIRVEAGLSHIVAQYEKKPKIRQIMGTKATTSNESDDGASVGSESRKKQQHGEIRTPKHGEARSPRNTSGK